MMSSIPASYKDLDRDELDRAIIRAAIMAELDAINMYKEMAQLARNKDLRKILHDIAREEKTHVGEFQALLIHLDEEQFNELKVGQREVDEKLDM
ncbi:rubrerythrin [Candidatus Woesearchaeota archaeon]|nr:MAG: rubrerythrin [Candidatus Woesearchaeota archaeon]